MEQLCSVAVSAHSTVWFLQDYARVLSFILIRPRCAFSVFPPVLDGLDFALCKSIKRREEHACSRFIFSQSRA